MHELPETREHDHLSAMSCQQLTPEFLASQDCVLIVTGHSAYDYDYIVRHVALVIDTSMPPIASQKGAGRFERFDALPEAA